MKSLLAAGRPAASLFGTMNARGLIATGMAVMGGVEIKVMYPGETARDARQRRRLEAREAREQRRLEARERRKRLKP